MSIALRQLATAAAFASAAIAAVHASAAPQMYKCVDGGRTVYQQQACPVSAAVEPAASAARPASAVAAAPASAAARRIKPFSTPASSAPARPR